MVFDGFNDTGLHVEIHVFFLAYNRRAPYSSCFSGLPIALWRASPLSYRDFYDNPVAMEDFPW